MTRIVLTEDGHVQFVYSDETRRLAESFTSFTPETTRRASNVEIEGGEWVSRLQDGTELCRGVDREPVVREEHRLIDEMLLAGIPIPV